MFLKTVGAHHREGPVRSSPTTSQCYDDHRRRQVSVGEGTRPTTPSLASFVDTFEAVASRAGSFSEILKISQIFGPTLTIYRNFIALIQFFCISVVRTYTILTSIYFPLLFD